LMRCKPSRSAMIADNSLALRVSFFPAIVQPLTLPPAALMPTRTPIRNGVYPAMVTG
jgi:hypothetical protein